MKERPSILLMTLLVLITCLRYAFVGLLFLPTVVITILFGLVMIISLPVRVLMFLEENICARLESDDQS